MTARHLDVFFYGLFMDIVILRGLDAQPVNPRRAYVEGLALRIVQRAALVPSPGARAYGMVFGLTHEDLDRLYSEPGLERYRPEAVLVHVLEGQSSPALCYNLPEAPRLEERNAEYAARLRIVMTDLGFPQDYVASVV
jgi:hypothetical protein